MFAGGRFIVFEGIDGSGKSTQARNLASHMDAVLTREPSEGKIGRVIREYLASDSPPPNEIMARLFAADRQEHVRQVIKPAVSSGKDVVCDRYLLSSMAYQSEGPMGVRDIWWINQQGSTLPRPDLTIYLDIEVEAALERVSDRGSSNETYEHRDYLLRVKDQYSKGWSWAQSWMKSPFLPIDAEGDEEEVFQRVLDQVQAHLRPKHVAG